MKVDGDLILGIFFASIMLIGWVLMFKFVFFPLIKQSFDAKKIKEFQNGHMFKAGGRFNLYNATFPFVNIKLDHRFIEIKSPDYNINLNYDQIVSVDYCEGFFSIGVEIKHNRQDIPQKIIIWTPFYNQLIDFIVSKKRIIIE